MATDIDLGEDDGFVNLTIGGVTLTLDLWELNDRIVACHEATKDKSAEEAGEAYLTLIESLGYPRPSRRIAQKFVETIACRVKELAGNP